VTRNDENFGFSLSYEFKKFRLIIKIIHFCGFHFSKTFVERRSPVKIEG